MMTTKNDTETLEFDKSTERRRIIPSLTIKVDEDENSIPTTIERFTSDDVQRQLAERMDEFEVQPGTQKLSEFIMQYHD